MAGSREPAESGQRRRPPATTPEAQENQMISLAVELAERQLTDGTASAQVITHFLKLGTTRERLEQTKIQHDIDMLKIKAEAIANSSHSAEMYENALNAFKTYSGQEETRYED